MLNLIFINHMSRTNIYKKLFNFSSIMSTSNFIFPGDMKGHI